MWGIPDQQADARRGFRFIPTYVGHTTARHIPRCRWTVHPHIRGAYWVTAATRRVTVGSSPHTWGIPISRQSKIKEDRFIPTCVGHTPGPSSSSCSPTVHPHIRGAYYVCSVCNSICSGSSPHTWGIRPQPRQPHLHPRFIPTYVGHTAPVPPCPSFSAVHPHIRGAYSLGALLTTRFPGSSPHTWGIPGSITWSQQWRPVHPHIRGAYLSSRITVALRLGSSPHTWGIPKRHSRGGCRLRFIPTYVGHTPRVSAIPDADRFIPTYVGHTPS